MKNSKVSAETRDKTIKEADLGVAGWALRGVRRVSALRHKKAGKIPSGELAYRGGQMLLGLALFLVVKAIFGIPFNFMSEAVLVCFLLGSQFGAIRFSAFSLIYWGVVGSIFGFAFGMWPLSPSWWSSAAQGWEGGAPVPKIVIGAGIIASIVWVAAGRLSSKGMGVAFVDALENWTFKRSQDVQQQRENDVEAEFEKAGVSRPEIDELARRNEADRRRAVVFGGSLRRRRAESESEGVSLAKTDEAESVVDPAEASRRIADLAGHVEEKDADVLAGLASGPDFGMLGTASAPVAPSGGPENVPSHAPTYDDDIPGPSANGIVMVDDDIPGPSNASSGSAATAIMGISEKVEAAVATVSAPKINPEASRGRRRMSREDLGKMIDLFNIMSREDNLDLFVNATRSKLIRLTDEDYEELRTLDGGDVLITLSQDLKLNDQSRSRTATLASSEVVVPTDAPIENRSETAAETQAPVSGDNIPTESDTNMAESDSRQGLSRAGATLVDAIDLMRGAASGRVPLGAVPAPIAAAPVEGEMEDYETEDHASTSTPQVEQPAVMEAVESPVESEDRPHEISAVTARGENVSFEVDIIENESTDSDMRRYPTPYASERVSILNNSALTDDQKVDRLRTLDRSQSVSTVDMFEGDEIVALLNLPTKVMTSLREKVRALFGEKPADMSVLQGLFDRRVELVQKDMFKNPHKYQEILAAFMAAGAEIQDRVLRMDTPQAREVMENSIRLDPWFEQNLAGVRSGRLKVALPLPAKGPGVLDRFSGTVDAAMRGAGLPGVRPQQLDVETPAEPAVRASEAIIDVAPRHIEPVEVPVQPKVESRRYEKGVDTQWTPDAPPGSDVYVTEMAEHFSLIVKRNDAVKAQAEREQREAAELAQRQAHEQAERDRAENERREREQAENDRVQREADFFARLPKSEGGHFVKSLPARFMTDEIMAAVTGIVDGHVIANRLQRDYVSQKIAFLSEWLKQKGSQPDAVDELSGPGQKLQAEVGIRNGDFARELLSHVAATCDLPADVPLDEIQARLVDDEEGEFVRRVESVRQRGEELRGLLDAAERRERAALAEAAREEARRQLSQARPAQPEADERVQRLETDLGERQREVEDLRARTVAAEAAAAERQAAAEASIRAADEMAARVRELEARIAVEEITPVADVEGGESEAAEAQLQAFLVEHLEPLQVRVDLKTYTGRVDGGLVVVVDLPGNVAEQNEIALGDRRVSLVEGIRRGIVRTALGTDPMLDTVQVVIVTNAPLSSDVNGEAMDLEMTSMDVCERDANLLHRLMRRHGVN